MTANLLATKLTRPAVPARRVRRPQLLQRLMAGLAAGRQLTLVSAPAGFGKTICVSEWAGTLDLPVTWLSLDRADDDPGRFFAYLVAALQKVDSSLGREIAGVLRAGQLPPGDVISTTFVNDILRLEGRFLLVLDDFQVIQEPSILQVLETLVTNLPPALHLVLLSREDPSLPLARLRANNQLTEIRAADLRFTRAETGSFLTEVMGLSLSPADVAVLGKKTEGWIAGLQLVALALQGPQPIRDRADPSDFIATLSGSHRFILSYLTEEVLCRQPEDIRDFLLQTSILDGLCGDLCNAVTGRTDSHFVLERLLNANLFLTPLDNEQRWYRYHRLFADLLRDLQSSRRQDETAELHRRASQWYALAGGDRSGERSAFASEAIQHALSATDYALVADLLERHATGMVMQGYAKTVEGWMQAIPQEWRSQSSRTNLTFAWLHGLRGNYAQASLYLERVQKALQTGEENPSIRAEWLALQALLLNMRGKAVESMALANEALAIVPEDDSHVRGQIYFALAGTYQLLSDYARTVEMYQRAIHHGRASENLVAEMMSVSGLAVLAFEHGQLQLAFEIASPISERVERAGSLPPISAVVDGVLGQIYYQWHQLERARHHILRAINLSSLGGYNSGAIFYGALLARLLQIGGDLDAAGREIQQAVDRMQISTPANIRKEVVYHQVCIMLTQNRLAAAETALEAVGFSFREGFSFPDLETGQQLTYTVGLLYTSALRILLHRAQARREPAILGPGIELAERLIAGALQGQYLLVALEALLLRAQMYAALGDDQADPAASQADYARALELAEPEGFIGAFVQEGEPVAGALAELLEQGRVGDVEPDYVRSILAACKSQTSDSTRGEPPTLIEPLTGRELDVLRLMAGGLKYKEIAERLFISLNTVRSHVKAIYGKLDANNRTQAVERARQLQIF